MVAKIKLGWTPEQIGDRMIYDGAALRVCQETIHRHTYFKEGIALALRIQTQLHAGKQARAAAQQIRRYTPTQTRSTPWARTRSHSSCSNALSVIAR